MSVVVQTWTVRKARALRQALRMSHKVFAEYIGSSRRTVFNKDKASDADRELWAAFQVPL